MACFRVYRCRIQVRTDTELTLADGNNGRALVRMLATNLRGPSASIVAGTEMLARPDLSAVQALRLAGNMLAAARRLEEILLDFVAHADDD